MIDVEATRKAFADAGMELVSVTTYAKIIDYPGKHFTPQQQEDAYKRAVECLRTWQANTLPVRRFGR